MEREQEYPPLPQYPKPFVTGSRKEKIVGSGSLLETYYLVLQQTGSSEQELRSHLLFIVLFK